MRYFSRPRLGSLTSYSPVSLQAGERNGGEGVKEGREGGRRRQRRGGEMRVEEGKGGRGGKRKGEER